MPVRVPNILFAVWRSIRECAYDNLLSTHAHEDSPEILLVKCCTVSRTSKRQAPQRASRAAGALMTASLSAQTTTETPAA